MDPITIALLSATIGGFATAVSTFYFDKLKSKARAAKGLQLARHEDVVAWGWSGRKLLDKLIKLDYAVVPQLNEVREGTIDQWAPVFMEHPHSWCLLVSRPKVVVGYWHFAAVRPEIAERIRQCTLQDSEITMDAIMDLDVPGHYTAYFTLIGVLEEHRRQGFPLLVGAFFDELATLAERGIYFSEVFANAYTEKGQDLCKGFKMKPLKEHEDYGIVFGIELIPWPASLSHRRYKRAKDAYACAGGHESLPLPPNAEQAGEGNDS